ncbi:hypothetical protein ACHHV8_32575 [Paenibacillus sp. TAB 01]|uniref:hypothetical protein n=1 Tax=Paenibacillus sp. TAB 01 TaxID=3368988 RepID=UPI003753C7C7
MDDFFKTAQRMWEDANILKNSTNKKSWFNTCYLSGYILECYGKLLLLSYGPSKRYGHDISTINDSITDHILINPSLAKYCLDFKKDCNTIYHEPNKWDPKKRYEGSTGIWDTEAIAEAYITEAQCVMDMINKMKLDGVI